MGGGPRPVSMFGIPSSRYVAGECDSEGDSLPTEEDPESQINTEGVWEECFSFFFPAVFPVAAGEAWTSC